jgi:16S rRNA G966 N2-methylase RsmD
MNKLNDKQKEEIIKLIQEDKLIPNEYRFLIPFETEKEYELIYMGKERKEDILVNTLSVPFQPIKKFGEIKENDWYNMLIFGDNLQALKHLLKLKQNGKLRNPDGKNGLKLIYIDPPFGTGDIYDASSGTPAYSAKLQGVEFIKFLRKRVILLRELLTDDGSIYIRLDYHYGHYIKVLMDEIFEKNNFRDEIIINRFRKRTFVSNKFDIGTDSLYLYSKTNSFRLNKITQPRVCSFCNSEVEPKWRGMSSPGIRRPPERIIMGKKLLPPKGRHWTYRQETIDELTKKGKIRINKSISFTDLDGNHIKGLPEYQQTDDIVVDSNWTDLKGYVFGSEYPTENPEELLERVIKASSNIGDIVLDCFAGSGTTGVVAEKLDRKWVMCDVGKFSIYYIQKRLFNMREKIGNRGRKIQPKSFILYNAGLYQNSGFIEAMDEEDYKKFVLELFSAEKKNNKIKGVQFHGILNNRPVLVFSQDDFLTHDFITDLHKTVGNELKDEAYIIVPQSGVRFNEDYVDKERIRYNILRVPYSIIQVILEKGFIRGLQPLSISDINKTIESFGFDFIYSPKVECEYYVSKEDTLFDNLVIKIKNFEPVQISKKPVKFNNPMEEALSMVMIDKNYDQKIFNMDHYFFNDEIAKNNYKVIFPKDKVGKKLMIIYLDVLGNEKVEVKNIDDFKINYE